MGGRPYKYDKTTKQMVPDWEQQPATDEIVECTPITEATTASVTVSNNGKHKCGSGKQDCSGVCEVSEEAPRPICGPPPQYFTPGGTGPGREKGVLNKLTGFRETLERVFHDVIGNSDMLSGLARKKPLEYVRIIASLQPKEIQATVRTIGVQVMMFPESPPADWTPPVLPTDPIALLDMTDS